MIPIDPANAVRIVRAFFVQRFLKLRLSDVKKLIDARPMLRSTGVCVSTSSGSTGRVSSVMTPSFRRTMRVAYCSASSGLCVTITTNRSRATSLSSSMICTLVSLSSAPVGSSASTMCGSFTSARAIATRCICPPESWFGRLWICSANPTFSSASFARRRRSRLETPLIVSASSTFASTLWCGIRL